MRMSISESSFLIKEISDFAISIYVQDCECCPEFIDGRNCERPARSQFTSELHLCCYGHWPQQESATARLSSFTGFTAAHEVRFRFPSFLAVDELVNNRQLKGSYHKSFWVMVHKGKWRFEDLQNDGVIAELFIGSLALSFKLKIRKDTKTVFGMSKGSLQN
jgi:hypothetical protein